MKVRPGRAPLRRLTRFEYNNTVRDLLGDTTSPGRRAARRGGGQRLRQRRRRRSRCRACWPSSTRRVAEGIAARATGTPAALAQAGPLRRRRVTAAGEEACARTIIEGFVPARLPAAAGGRRGRRPAGALPLGARAGRRDASPAAVAAVIEAVLQSPDFLYRVELGVADRRRPELRAPHRRRDGHPPVVLALGDACPTSRCARPPGRGELATAAGGAGPGHAAAGRSPRAARWCASSSTTCCPSAGCPTSSATRCSTRPTRPAIGALMQEETQRLLEYEIFEGGGTWPAALTAPHTFVNGPLAAFYRMPGVQGTAFQKVPLDTTQRLGFLTHASVMAGTTHSNHTNPVRARRRSSCRSCCASSIPLPDASIAEKVKPPDPYSGKTARERFTKHQRGSGVRGLPRVDGSGGLRARELRRRRAVPHAGERRAHRRQRRGAGRPRARSTARRSWRASWPPLRPRRPASPGTGCSSPTARRSAQPSDECVQAAVNVAFHKAGYDVRQLLLALTQTDAFLYYAGSQ